MKNILIGVIIVVLIGGAVFAGSYITSKNQAGIEDYQAKNSDLELPVPITPKATTTSATTPPERLPSQEELKAKENLEKTKAEMDKLKKENVALNQIKIATDAKAQAAKDEYVDGLTILVSKYENDIDYLNDNFVLGFDPFLECLVEKGRNNGSEIKYFTNLKEEMVTFLNQTNWFMEALKAKKIEYKQKSLSFYYNFDYVTELGKDQLSYDQNPIGLTEWEQAWTDGENDGHFKTKACEGE